MSLVTQTWVTRLLRGKWRFPCMSWFSHQVVLYFCTLNILSQQFPNQSASVLDCCNSLLLAFTDHQRTGGASYCWCILALQLVLWHGAETLLRQLDYNFESDMMKRKPFWMCLSFCSLWQGLPAMYMYTYIYWWGSGWFALFCLYCAVLCSSVFSSAVIIKTLLISFGHWLFSPHFLLPLFKFGFVPDMVSC